MTLAPHTGPLATGVGWPVVDLAFAVVVGLAVLAGVALCSDTPLPQLAVSSSIVNGRTARRFLNGVLPARSAESEAYCSATGLSVVPPSRAAKSRACLHQQAPHWINPSESVSWPKRRQVRQRPKPVTVAPIRNTPVAIPRAHSTTPTITGQPMPWIVAQLAGLRPLIQGGLPGGPYIGGRPPTSVATRRRHNPAMTGDISTSIGMTIVG
jgi:hypothetical protein